MHYARLTKRGAAGAAGPERASGRTCSVVGCRRKHHANGYCSAHARRFAAYGNPEATPIARSRDPGRRAFFDALVASPPEADGCVLWPYRLTRSGYGQISIDNRTHKVHRALLLAVAGPPPSMDMDAAHICNVRHCVNPRHLRWSTRQANVHDKRAAGTHGQRLSAENALAICRERGTLSAIAKRYGVSESTIHNVRSGKTWGWLTGRHRSRT